ncbi:MULTISPECIES: class I SAM-dependent methyltransferase [Pseudomonas]|uniref:Class I SAM-dependent methyltransferase n=1 Tax=Pseudomonas aphyarum TaxID=2942629 RepID=A0ABT5PHU4_9PSED|nr:class I SAM-dependent methyltransferase [Pseudomonas aphyarum]MDD0970041.1 class I SAM-dependent methyltransferase [Pseudomonas aphyarum]MDD1123447.1 class I SAM-dependent methyltransferase [Pseudomonas aphyarum]
MIVIKLVNKLLSVFDIAIVRRSSLSRLTSEAARSPVMPAEPLAVVSIASVQDLLADRISTLQQDLVRGRISSQWYVIDQVEGLLPAPVSLTCELCGASHPLSSFKVLESHCVFGGGRLIRHQCPDCDAVFGPSKMMRLSPAELSQDYAVHYSVYQEGDSTDLEIRTFHALNPTKEGIYLNFGAGGWSRSVQILREQGWNVMAYEPHHSGDASHEPYVISSEQELNHIKFDGIFSNNVLEHFRHPLQEMRSMSQLLKPGGKMSHTTPCFEYLYEFTRFHLFFYLGRSREVLAEKANLLIDSYTEDGEFINYIYSVKH